MSESTAAVETLVRKLPALDLTDTERALLDAVVASAAEPETAGFGFIPTPKMALNFEEIRVAFDSPSTMGYTEVEWTYVTGITGVARQRS